MKRIVTLCAAVGAGLLMTSFALAADLQYDLSADTPPTPATNRQPTYLRGSMTAYFADADKKEGDAKKDDTAAKEDKADAQVELRLRGSVVWM